MTDEQKTLNYKESWQGWHRGIQFEVVHWRLGWNYYIFIPIDQLPEQVQPMFNLRGKKLEMASGRDELSYDYYKAKIIPNLDWHGGITLYEKSRNAKGEVIGYRLGCDYMHIWDEGRIYNLTEVITEVKHSIDKLWEYIPDLKLRCAWNGRYYNVDKVYYTDKGVCVALENKVEWGKPL